MAILPLSQPVEWGWDDVAKQLILRMRERHIDDADVEPTREAIVRLNVASVNVRNLPTPPA